MVDDFPDRLRTALKGSSARAFAAKANISPTAMNKYLRGDAGPSRGALMRIAEAAGVSLEWLITGKGQIEPGDGASLQSAPPSTATPATDAELLALLMDGISKAYKETSARISPADMGRLAARHHDQICFVTADPAARRLMAQLVFAQLRAELSALTVANSAQIKRLTESQQ